MLLKIKLIKQDNAGHLFYFIFLTNKTKTHTLKKQKTKKMTKKKRKQDEITHSRPRPFSF